MSCSSSGLGHFGNGGHKCFLWKCFWNMLFMSIWWPEILHPGNYHVSECAMKGFCEWFRDMPIMAWPNICVGLPTISKWTSSIAHVFSWYLCGVYSWYLWSCVNMLKKTRVKIRKCSYQSFLSTDSLPRSPLPKRRCRNVPCRSSSS